MTRSIAISSSAQPRLEWAWRHIEPLTSELLILAPATGAADDFVRAFAATGILGAHRMTLGQLASRIAGDWLTSEISLSVLDVGSDT